jgi:hypothetical protein
MRCERSYALGLWTVTAIGTSIGILATSTAIKTYRYLEKMNCPRFKYDILHIVDTTYGGQSELASY